MSFESPEEQDLADLASRAKRGFLWVLSTTAIWQTLSWVLTLLTARLLSPVDYGLMAIGEVMMPYFALIASFRIGAWMLRERVISKEDEEGLFTLTLLLGAVTTLAAIVVAPYVANFYEAPQMGFPLQLMAATLFLASLQMIPTVRLQRNLDFKPLAVSNLVVGTARGVIQLVLAWLGFAFWSLVIGALFKEVMHTAWLIVVGGIPRSFRWTPAVYKKALIFGGSATLSTVFWVIFSTADNLIVGKLFGIEAMGFYAMAFYLAEMPLSKLNSVINPVLSPYLARISFSFRALRNAYLNINRGILTLLVPVQVGLAVVAPVMVPVVIGEHWTPTVIPFQVLCFVGILRSLPGNAFSLLLAINKPHHHMLYSAFTAVVLPVSFYVLGSWIGIRGIYLSWLVIYPLAGLLPLAVILKRTAGIEPSAYLGIVKAPAISALVMSMMCIGIAELLPSIGDIWLLAVQIAAGALAYVAMFWFFFRRESLKGFVQLRSLIRRS